MEDKLVDGKRMRSNSFTYGTTGTAAFPANRSVGFSGNLIQPLSEDINKKISVLTFRKLAKEKNITSESIKTIVRSGNERCIIFASSLINEFPELLAIKLLETYCKTNYSSHFEEYVKRVKAFELYSVQAQLLVDAYDKFAESRKPVDPFFYFFEKVPYGKISEMFKILEDQEFSEEAGNYILDVLNQDFGQRNEAVALTYIDDLLKNEEARENAFLLLKDQDKSSGEHLLKIYKSFSFDTKKIDEKIAYLESDKKSVAKKIVHTTGKKVKTKEKSLFEKFQDQEFLKSVANTFSDKLSSEDAKALTALLTRKERAEFERLNNNNNLSSNKSFALKIKWIANYEEGLELREKEAKLKIIDDSSLYYEQSLDELYRFLEIVNYNKFAIDVLDLVDNNYKDAEKILNSIEVDDLNQLLTIYDFTESQITLFASCKNKKEVVEIIKSLSKPDINGFFSSGKRVAFLAELASAKISIDLIKGIGQELAILDDLFAAHTDILLSVFKANKNIDAVKLAKNEKYWLTFDVACLTLLKVSDNDIKDVFTLFKKLHEKVGYRPNQLEIFLSGLTNDIDLSAIKVNVNKWIFAEIENEVGEVIKIKKGTRMSPKGREPYTLNKDIMETGNRFLSNNEAAFNFHLKKINYLLQENYISVRVTDWQFEKVGLLTSDFTIEKDGKHITQFTMHKHPGAGKAAVGSTESSDLHFKPTDSSGSRYKDGSKSISTLWNKKK